MKIDYFYIREIERERDRLRYIHIYREREKERYRERERERKREGKNGSISNLHLHMSRIHTEAPNFQIHHQVRLDRPVLRYYCNSEKDSRNMIHIRTTNLKPL